MPVFHAPAHCASHSERGDRALARLVEQVNALRARPLNGEDFEAMERELRALFAEAEREVVPFPEPPRVSRRVVCLSQAAIADSRSW